MVSEKWFSSQCRPLRGLSWPYLPFWTEPFLSPTLWRGLPVKWCLPREHGTIPDYMSHWGFQQRLGCDAPGAGRTCARPACGVHSSTCSWGQVCKRHDELRDLIAHAARQVGMAATIEQNIAPEPDTPGDVRPIHRADVRIVEPDGR